MKSYTDLEQSKKLAEILPLESADMYYCYGMDLHTKKWDYDIIPTIIDESNQIDIGDIPCWSLAALIDVLPQFIEFKGDKYYLRFMKEYIEYANDEVSITGRYLRTTGNNNNLVDVCYEMILELHKLKML